MWERFSYAGTRAILVLYLTSYLLLPPYSGGVVGLSALRTTLAQVFGTLNNDALALQIYGLYVGLFYLTPLLGGLLADKVLGHRGAILLGSLIMATGQFCLANGAFSLIGLLLMVIGGGLFKPTVSAQLGSLFQRDDRRADLAFSVFYVAINVGTFFAPLVCGTLGERLGWQYGFAVAGIGNLVSVTIYLAGRRAVPDRSRAPVAPIAAAPAGSGARGQMPALFAVALISALFWAAYEQKGGAVILWARRSVDLTVGGFVVPTSWILVLNPLFIMLFTPPLTIGFGVLARRGYAIGTLDKMIGGFVLLALGYLLLGGAAWSTRIGLGWVVAYMALLTLGELLLSPVGLSLFSRAAPAGRSSQLVAIWLFAAFIGNYASGMIASAATSLSRQRFFLEISGLPLLGAATLLMFRRPLIRRLFANA